MPSCCCSSRAACSSAEKMALRLSALSAGLRGSCMTLGPKVLIQDTSPQRMLGSRSAAGAQQSWVRGCGRPDGGSTCCMAPCEAWLVMPGAAAAAVNVP
jgi:hypothetical protein